MPYGSTGDRVNIGVRDHTREQLREEKREDETWDDLLLRLRDQARPRTAQLREGETRDDTHASRNAEQLAMANDEGGDA